MIYQRNVVEVQFRLPSDGRLEEHPVIVLSNDEINEIEDGFVAVMMTSQEKFRDDEYSFELDDSMFTKPLGKKFSAVRLHLVGNFIENDVISNFKTGNQMKLEPFKRLLVHLNRTTFGLQISKIE